jgi:amidase
MNTARLCEDLGHDVEEASPRLDSELLFKSFGKVMTGYLNWSISKWSLQTGRQPIAEEFEAVTWRMYQHSLKQTSGEYLLAWQDLQKCCRQFAAFFNDYDLWLTPTLVKPPVPIGYFSYSYETRMQHIERLGHFTGFTMISNASGQPAVSLPLHWTNGNLPIGVQLTGRFGDEAGLFRLAGQLEQALPWSHRRPPQ